MHITTFPLLKWVFPPYIAMFTQRITYYVHF